MRMNQDYFEKDKASKPNSMVSFEKAKPKLALKISRFPSSIASGSAATHWRKGNYSSALSIRQQLSQTGFMFVFFDVFLVLHALHRRRCPQHCP